MDGAGSHGRRPRPVADAPAVDAVAVAKAWLLALVADAPLQQAGSVPAAELARGGPALAGGILAALGSDGELQRLIAGDGRAPLGASAARLTGARSAAGLAAGVEALRAAAWRMLRAELRDPAPELVADLGDRLAYVCARVTEASLSAPLTETPRRGGPLAEALSATPAAPAQPPLQPQDPAGVAAYMRPPAVSGASASAGTQPSDPGHDVTPYRGEPAHAGPPGNGAAGMPAPPPAGVEPFDLPPAPASPDPLTSLAEELAAAPPTGVTGAPPQIVFTPAADTPAVTRLRPVDTSWDEAAEAGPPWLGAISRRLERREHDGLPFAVLVVEVDDLDRLLASQTGREVAVALETAERGLTAELAPADMVVRERLGRWWLTSPDRDPAAARDLGSRVAAAIGRAVLGSAPLTASIGVAVCPHDGESLDALAGRADEGMFAARAAGVPVA
jgi:GGDEF domain-containing protein